MTPILILTSLLATDPGSALEIEKKALAEQEKIERGEVTWFVTRRHFERSGEIKSSRTSKYEVTFDGSNVRTIKNRREWYVFTDKYALSHLGSRDDLDPMPAYQRDLTTPQGRRSENSAYRMNMRLLGIMPQDTVSFKTRKLTEYLTQPDRKDTKVTSEKVDGRNVFKIEYEKTEWPTKVTYVIDPEKGYSVIEASHQTPDYTDRIENRMKLYDDKYWYPETVRYTRSGQGKAYSESLITVKKAEFNRPIDKDVFTFNGISLPAGTRVIETPRAERTRYWDGEKLVPRNELDPDIPKD